MELKLSAADSDLTSQQNQAKNKVRYSNRGNTFNLPQVNRFRILLIARKISYASIPERTLGGKLRSYDAKEVVCYASLSLVKV